MFSTSRIEAGDPFTDDVFQCELIPVESAIERALYGDWRSDAGQRQRLEATFPTGVCDFEG